MKKNIEKIDMTCPRCHGTMEINEEKNELNCPFCRHTVFLDEEEDIDELAEKEKKLSYARTEGANLANEKAERKRKIKGIFGKIIKRLIRLAIFIIIIYAIFKWIYLSRPFMDDPFEHVKYEFSGTNGRGKAEIIIDNNVTGDIEYSVSKDSNLSNDEIITVKAFSINYRLGMKEKKIKVQGLYNKLTSFNQLTKQMKDYIHSKSTELQKDKIKNGYSFKGKLTSLDKYKMFLHTDGKNKSILYDVYTAKIKAKSGKVYTRYVVTKYDNIVIINQNNDLLRFERRTNVGGIIQAAGKSGNDYCRIYDWI